VATLDLPSFDSQLSALAWQGLVNRAGPQLYLQNPRFDAVDGADLDLLWLRHLHQRKGFTLAAANGSSLCDLLRLRAAPPRLVVHDAVGGGEPEPARFGAGADLDGARYAAMSYASSIGGLPVSASMLRRGAAGDSRFSCLLKYCVAANFSGVFKSEQSAYGLVTDLVAAGALNRSLFVAALDPNSTMAGGWLDPSSYTSVDLGFREHAAVINLSPSPTAPAQRALFDAFLSAMHLRATLVGWTWTENDMCSILTRTGSRAVDGAPNLSLWRGVPTNGTPRLPASRRVDGLDRTKVYIIFQTGAGDTATNAIAGINGMWHQPERGSVPLSWGVDPLVGHMFPAIWEFYATTATKNDTFFAETAGAGYAWPFHFPASPHAATLEAFYTEVGELMALYGPASGLLDLWEDDNRSKVARAIRASGGRIRAVTRPPLAAGVNVGNGSAEGALNGAIQSFGGKKTPYIASARPLWYSVLNGSSNPGDDGLGELEARILGAAAALPTRPLFLSIQSLGFKAERKPLTAWGGLLAAAVAMAQRLDSSRFEVVGADDLVALATEAVRDAAPDDDTNPVSTFGGAESFRIKTDDGGILEGNSLSSVQHDDDDDDDDDNAVTTPDKVSVTIPSLQIPVMTGVTPEYRCFDEVWEAQRQLNAQHVLYGPYFVYPRYDIQVARAVLPFLVEHTFILNVLD
jgi:hypothetical protein